MKNIFAPYEIAKQLKEIGFDEPCMAFYQEEFEKLYTMHLEPKECILALTDIISVSDHNIGEDEISAPTWEQVFKWFREKGIYSEIIIYRSNFKSNIIISDEEGIVDEYYSKVRENYEQARENLALELIELYKNEN